MAVGRSAPRYQSMAMLYPRSSQLQDYLFEYYIVVVGLCHRILKFAQKTTVGQLAGSLANPNLNQYQSQLEQWAAAIKEEVSILSAKTIEEEARESSRFRALTTKTSTADSQLQRLKTNQRILSSVSTYDFEKTWKETRKAGSTTLLDHNATYQNWRDQGESCTLVYTGNLGSGKSVVLANMIDDISLNVQDKTIVVTYFFIRHDILKSLEARTIIGALAYQFLRMAPDLDLTRPARLVSTRLEFDVDYITVLLQEHLPTDFRAYVILDGMDDCQDAERNQLLSFIRAMQQKFKIRLCVSHRIEGSTSLEHYLGEFIAATSTAVPDENPDIDDFIEAELERCIRSRKLVLGDPSLVLEIQDALQAGSKGMFLWTALQIETLCFMKTDMSIRQALRDLPQDLSKTFSRILMQSSESDTSYREPILNLVIAAKRPLTTEELREALSVVPNNTNWEPTKLLNDITSALSCCGSLLVIDEEDLSVRFVHHSVKQFLLHRYTEKGVNRAFTEEGAKRKFTKVILTYLNYNIFDTQLTIPQSSQVRNRSPIPQILDMTLGSSSLVSNLALYFLKSRKQPGIDIRKVLQETTNASGTGSIRQHYFRYYAQAFWKQHVLDVSYFDPVVYKLLLKLVSGNEVDILATHEFGGTLLSLAADRKHSHCPSAN